MRFASKSQRGSDHAVLDFEADWKGKGKKERKGGKEKEIKVSGGWGERKHPNNLWLYGLTSNSQFPHQHNLGLSKPTA